MKKEIYKKGFVFGAVVVLVTIALFMPTSIGKNVENIDLIIKENINNDKVRSILEDVPPYDTTTKTYTLSLNPMCPGKETDNHCLYNVTLIEDESKKFENEIGKIDEQMSKEKDLRKYEDLTRQKLEVLRNYNILPKEFTIENFSDLTRQIGESISILNLKGPSNSPNSMGLKIGTPFVSVGPSVFSYITGFGTVTPAGFSPAGPRALEIWGLNETEIILNSTGIFWKGTGPILAEGKVKIQNRIWEYLFPINETRYVNYTEMHAMGMYYGHLLLGHTFAVGFAFPNYVGRLTGTSLIKPIIGSFYYLGMVTFPLSFTIYKTWPQPWTTIIDFGIVPSLLASIILPFWFPETIEAML